MNPVLYKPSSLQFDVILFDQGKTFMFGNDRFGDDVDYHATYVALGGKAMTPALVGRAVEQLFNYLLWIGRQPRYFDKFPRIGEVIRELPALRIPAEDEERIDDLIAVHEIGFISARHASVLRALSRTHRLGIISNIWARSRLFEDNLLNHGVRDVFEHLVWSSEHGCLKPSRFLFTQALALFGVPAERVLFVGDHPMRDIDAAGTLGCGTVWIRNAMAEFPAGLRAPDRIIDDLSSLPDVVSNW